MRLMMRWSPMSNVFSIEPDGMTRAWPMAPLMSRNTRPTQNHAIISRWIFVPTGTCASVFFSLSALAISALAMSSFTMHHHRPFCGRGFTVYCNRRRTRFSVGSRFADLQLHKICRVNTRITRRTEPAFGISDSLFQGRQREVAQRVRAQEFADVLRRVRRRDQFLARGRIHAIVAGGNRWRATDAHVNFFCSGVADHAHDFAAGGAADDGIVHQHDALAFDKAAHGIELQFDAEVSDGLQRLDERAADVMIANQAHAEGNSGIERVAYGGGHAGIRDGDNDVGLDGMFAGEQAAEHFATLVDGAAKNDAVRPREVNMLENALLVLLGGSEVNGLDAALGDAHHFAGLDFADVLRVEQIERAGFAGDEPGGAAAGRRKFAENERAEAARIARGVKLVGGEDEKRIGAFNLIQRVAQRAGKIAGLRTRKQMHDDFGVAIGLENGAAMLEFAAPFVRVGEVAVVAKGDFAFVAIDDDGLRVQQRLVAGRRIARVADGERPGKFCENARLKNLFDSAHGAVEMEFRAVAGDDTGGFLAAMLEGIKAEVSEVRGFGMAGDAKHAAVVVNAVVEDHAILLVDTTKIRMSSKSRPARLQPSGGRRTMSFPAARGHSKTSSRAFSTVSNPRPRIVALVTKNAESRSAAPAPSDTA